jgi:hypothetical protein
MISTYGGDGSQNVGSQPALNNSINNRSKLTVDVDDNEEDFARPNCLPISDERRENDGGNETQLRTYVLLSDCANVLC